MWGGAIISKENRAVLAARIKQRVKEYLPEGQYMIFVQEVPCGDTACPTRATVISVCDEQGSFQKWAIHAPMQLVTAKEIKMIMRP